MKVIVAYQIRLAKGRSHVFDKIFGEVMKMHWYVIFVKSGREYKAEQFLKIRLDTHVAIPFIPTQEILFRTSEMVKKEQRLLFPGYIFVESGLPNKEFLKIINSLILSSSDIVRILRYSNSEIAMRESEKQRLISLCNKNHCIESSSGIIKGDKIYITDGPLKGCESIVRKVNRHKRQAMIEIQIIGDVRLVSVALEVVDKITI